MQATRDRSDVFFSYAHTDLERVIPIVNALRARGLRVWLDPGLALCW